jgi:hypothetical protein
MTRPILVELPRTCDGAELVDFLAARGLTASLVSTNDHCEIEIREAVDPEERLRRECDTALRGWLAQHEPPLIPVWSRERGYVLRPPAD